MRGDRPSTCNIDRRRKEFTPHARGSTASCLGIPLASNVYPACAGIDLKKHSFSTRIFCLPRMRGDRPLCADLPADRLLFTPHARGSTSFLFTCKLSFFVYPACAGIDPFSALAFSCFCGLPRMRGDRPLVCVSVMVGGVFTPHARGSTCMMAC